MTAQVTLGPGAPEGPAGHFSQGALGRLLSALSSHWEYGMKGQVTAFKPQGWTRPPALVGKANVPEARLMFGPQDTARTAARICPHSSGSLPWATGPRPWLLHLRLRGGESCSLQDSASSQCTEPPHSKPFPPPRLTPACPHLPSACEVGINDCPPHNRQGVPDPLRTLPPDHPP